MTRDQDIPVPEISVDDCMIARIINMVDSRCGTELTVDDIRDFGGSFGIQPHSCFQALEMRIFFNRTAAIVR